MAITAFGFRKRLLMSTCILNMIALCSAMPTTEQPTIDNEIFDAFSKARQEYAKKMLTYMNLSVDPCDDFYEYACGNWPNVIEEHNINHKRGNLLDLVFNLNKVAEELLSCSAEELQVDAYANEWELSQKFYQSCLQADLMPMKRSEEYLQLIRTVGGFPAVDELSWDAQQFDWFNMSAHLSNYGVKAFINDEILPQYPFSPYFKLPELGFNISVHSDNIATKTSNAYVRNEQRMVGYLKTYGVDTNKIPQIVEEIFQLWHAILNVTESFNDDFERCLQLDSDDVDGDVKEYEGFKKYYDIAWKGEIFPYEICNHYYIELDKICSERKEAAANYMALKFLFDMDAQLNNEKFHKEFCTIKISSSMPYLIDNVYLKKYFAEGIRDEIYTIISETRYSLRQILQEADWLDEATREEALKKESSIIIRIGSLEDDTLKQRLIREMRNLNFTEGNFEANNLELKKFKTFMSRYLGLHNEQNTNVTKPLELLRAMTVNAFYYNLDNSINIMAGILYPPAYDNAWPNSLKYGTIGYLIGHEFTHGFDTVGGLFDSTGEERSWWSKKSAQVFEHRANCYANHYSNYLVPEINRNINGNLTKDENIADSGGLREALTAYRRYMKEQTKKVGPKATMLSEEMPGLDLSPEQIFFLGFSQLWCASLKEEHYWQLLTDEHTIDKYRVLGALTNYDEFAKVYNCPLGSNMHPTEAKCRVW